MLKPSVVDYALARLQLLFQQIAMPRHACFLDVKARGLLVERFSTSLDLQLDDVTIELEEIAEQARSPVKETHNAPCAATGYPTRIPDRKGNQMCVSSSFVIY